MTFTNKLAAVFMTLACASSSAAVISDTGPNNYWGGNHHGYGDSIGGALYDISAAHITLSGSMLTIRIVTSFAGHAGDAAWAGPNGIGYGDVFLAPSWNPSGSDAHHGADNTVLGTKWTYGLSLDNRWSNSGGSFRLFELNGATNATSISNSESFLTCAMGSQCYYRDGQAVAVKTASSTVRDTGLQGQWSVNPNQDLVMSINIAGTSLAQYGEMALHWGETCQNDVIEGIADVPEPAGVALFGLGIALMALRRRQK